MSKKTLPVTENNTLQAEDKKNYAEELISANKELAYQNHEKEKRAAELVIANKELALQVIEKGKRAAELVIANKELAFQNIEKERRAAELIIANIELAYQNQEKEDRAAELIVANKELALQVTEKGKRASELIIANKELAYQNKEKEKRAAELVIANTELAYQNQEKEDRAAELIIANKELALQVTEKEKRAAELIIANKELAFQNKEKEKRAAELAIANKELAYQNKEKEDRAAELIIANKELAYQNEEKEKRAAELLIANKELESFAFISSHDLQEPLRKIQAFSGRIFDEEYDNLSPKGKYYVERTRLSALHMQTLINDLLTYSRTSVTQRKFENSDLNKIVQDVMDSLKEQLQEKSATIEVHTLSDVNIIPFQFRQLLQNLISNSLKFCKPELKSHIIIKSNFIKYNSLSTKKYALNRDHHHISIADNGIGFDPEFNHKIFEIFQRLHEKGDYEGTGIGLTIARKIVENHHGIITANGKLNKGATFNIYIPAVQN
ncbi:ATP-binding protein [Flavobacterium sp. 5]|uniref:sensor histidine kinase n=1 Tax=Flavobacterium sp. 5 TaxID=2035199 RepID=UPI000C2BEC2F|nr:ATP-binding protein [Flavobacterium sp. 5]PKB18210.1 histidine kinase/DNA gyrase B/HSP90-like ATPase [Flavobacterium sp. 5]